MMTEFTPLTSLLGGALLGFSALLLMLFNGRIAGISGIVNGAMMPRNRNEKWRWLFILGVILGPIIVAPFGSQLPTSIDSSWPLIIIGGLFVGFGSHLGSGCTSGHGICGMGRMSYRSIIATMTFMVTAIGVVYIVRHIVGL